MDTTRLPPGRLVPRPAAPSRYPKDRPEWRSFAACRGINTLFYKSDLDSDEQTRHRVTKAKTLCARCPVRPQCAAYALAVAEPYGVWGGFTESERALLLTTDWRRYADRRCTAVDVANLQARLHAIRVEEHAAALAKRRPDNGTRRSS